MEIKVFISYAREDIDIARRLYDDLEQKGIEPWLDEKKLLPGEDWKESITRAIRKTDFFLLLLSSKSLSKTGFIQKEIKIALDILKEFPPQKIFVIPVRINECEPEHEDLYKLHRLDLFPSYQNGVNKIIRAIMTEQSKREKIKSSYFYHIDLFKKLVSVHEASLQAGNDFIKSSEFSNSKYYSERYRPKIGNKKMDLPYHEGINFIEEPTAEIKIINDLTLYTMRNDIRQITSDNLNAFLKAEPNSNDSELARLVYLKSIADNKYQCCLEKSGYFQQARTNLTLDCQIEYQNHEVTLRKLDMDSENRLKPFEQSILANTLGVCAVVYYLNETGIHIFTKYREKQGIFNKILGMLSCVVSPPAKDNTDLITHLKGELRKKIEEEVGLDASMIMDSHPLSLCRELIRGGKPQFFFIIKVKESDNFSKVAQDRVEETRGFIEDVHKRALEKKALSTEFVVNLIYAFQYFSKKYKEYKSYFNKADYMI